MGPPGEALLLDDAEDVRLADDVAATGAGAPKSEALQCEPERGVVGRVGVGARLPTGALVRDDGLLARGGRVEGDLTVEGGSELGEARGGPARLRGWGG